MFEPLEDYLAILPTKPEEVTISGLVIPEVAQEKVPTGTVVAAGKGKTLPDGATLKMPVQVGDLILYYDRPNYIDFVVDGEKCFLMRSTDLIARIIDEKETNE